MGIPPDPENMACVQVVNVGRGMGIQGRVKQPRGESQSKDELLIWVMELSPQGTSLRSVHHGEKVEHLPTGFCPQLWVAPGCIRPRALAVGLISSSSIAPCKLLRWHQRWPGTECTKTLSSPQGCWLGDLGICFRAPTYMSLVQPLPLRFTCKSTLQ